MLTDTIPKLHSPPIQGFSIRENKQTYYVLDHRAILCYEVYHAHDCGYTHIAYYHRDYNCPKRPDTYVGVSAWGEYRSGFTFNGDDWVDEIPILEAEQHSKWLDEFYQEMVKE